MNNLYIGDILEYEDEFYSFSTTDHFINKLSTIGINRLKLLQLTTFRIKSVFKECYNL